MRWASAGEEFVGIGMEEPKVTTGTGNIFSLMCGVPRIRRGVLREAAETTISHMTRFRGGSGNILAQPQEG